MLGCCCLHFDVVEKCLVNLLTRAIQPELFRRSPLPQQLKAMEIILMLFYSPINFSFFYFCAEISSVAGGWLHPTKWFFGIETSAMANMWWRSLSARITARAIYQCFEVEIRSIFSLLSNDPTAKMWIQNNNNKFKSSQSRICFRSNG